MAADQRRKRLNGVTVIDSSLRDKFREKKKQMASPESGYKVKPHISLQWDGSRKKVVSKKAQIGLSSRNLGPFVESLPHGHRTLADAFDLPSEIFKLRNLEGVLSYETWQSCLSEEERNFLMQFLPEEMEAQQVVKQLLVGDDLHFGNPFLKWAGSVLSGGQHPDAVLHHEKSIKADKREYYLQLQKYHSNMIDSLSKMKERWESCKDAEKEFNHWIISKSRKDEAKISRRADGSGFHVLEDDVATESSSLGPKEKTSNSDGHNPSVMKGEELQKRAIKKKITKNRSGNSSAASDDLLNGDVKQRTGVRLKKRNILYNDGTEYMSYVKVSKKQHEFAKSMEESGTSIQSRSLGNLKNLQIQPYEVYVEEQQKKLHDHWLQLATNDLPAAYEMWKDFHGQRRHMMSCLEQELNEKFDSLMQDEEEEEEEEEEEIQETMVESPEGHEEIGQLSTMEEENEASLQSQQSNQSEENAPSSEEEDEELVPGFHQDDEAMNHQNESIPHSVQNMEVTVSMDSSNWDADNKFVPCSSANQVPSLRAAHSFNHLNLEREIKAGSSTAHQDISTAFSGDLTNNDHHLLDIHRAASLTRGNDMWRPVRMEVEPTYYDSGHYGSTSGEMPLVHPPANESRTQEQHWIHKNLLHHAQPSEDSFHSSFQSRDQTDLLHSIFNKAEPKSAALNFQPSSNMLARHFQEPLQLPPLPMQQTMSANLVPNGGGFLLQRQERHLLPVSMQDWGPTPNPIHVPSTLQSPLTVGELPSTQNWFGSATTQQSIGSGSNLDQSLYSVLPQLSSRPQYDPLGCSDQPFVPSRSFGMMGGGIGIPLPQTTAPPSLNYLNRRDSVISDESGWMSLPHQNPDSSMGKPFMGGSWNQ